MATQPGGRETPGSRGRAFLGTRPRRCSDESPLRALSTRRSDAKPQPKRNWLPFSTDRYVSRGATVRAAHPRARVLEHDRAMSDPRVLDEHYSARRRSVGWGENDCRFCHSRAGVACHRARGTWMAVVGMSCEPVADGVPICALVYRCGPGRGAPAFSSLAGSRGRRVCRFALMTGSRR